MHKYKRRHAAARKQQESESASVCLKRWKGEENILPGGLWLGTNVWD